MESEWKDNRRVEEGREVLKVSESNMIIKVPEFQHAWKDGYNNVGEHGLVYSEEE